MNNIINIVYTQYKDDIPFNVSAYALNVENIAGVYFRSMCVDRDNCTGSVFIVLNKKTRVVGYINSVNEIALHNCTYMNYKDIVQAIAGINCQQGLNYNIVDVIIDV